MKSFLLSLFLVFLPAMAENTTTSTGKVINVGVIVSSEESMMLSYIEMALSDFYGSHSHFKTRLALHTRDSMADVVGAAAAAVDLIKVVGVQAILGPRTSMQTDFVIKIGEKSQVPIISYSATSPSLTNVPSPYFFRATQNDSSQVDAITSIVQAFGWREIVPVYIDNEFGFGIVPHLIDELQSIGSDIPYRSSISIAATDDDIERELYKLMSMQTRVFVVHMPLAFASKFFPKVKEVGMMSIGYVWIVTHQIADFINWLSPSVINSMEGVIGIRSYVPNSTKLENFRVRWKSKFHQDNQEESSINGLRAYDAATALAMAIEKSGIQTASFEKKSISTNYSTDLSNLGVSQNGPKLVEALSTTRFKGITGDFFFVDKQLPSFAFEIVNLIGERARGIGFWTTRNGLVRTLKNPISSNLGTVIWPGDSVSVPKGWEIPTNGRRLRIGVPMKQTKFVNVTIDEVTNVAKVTGFCIDVFDAVAETLPYALTYDYVPFVNPDGTSAGTYDDLVNQVYLKKLDGVVGDITIRGNRSRFVDFTLPYTESGVAMVVPLRDENHKNAWAFLKPLTWDLWLASLCLFVFIGFVVWVLEHRVNEDFRGPPLYQAATFFSFSFSTIVFSNSERVVSNMGRTLMIIWSFVVLILMQSYTASLTSLLTVQKLKPMVSDLNEVMKNKQNVGYPKGSFVLGILERLDFDKSNLKMYNSSDQFHQLFSNGTIFAAFDEVPYLKYFLAQKYCSKLTMLDPTFMTDGFGFAFPKGSPLVADISRAILNVKEGSKMRQIELAWFGKDTTCPDPSTSTSSNSLSLQSFWGLFLLAGTTSVIALVLFTSMFLYQHRQVLVSPDPQASTWTKIVGLFRIFDQKDLTAHTFKNRDQNEIISSEYCDQSSNGESSSEESNSNRQTPSTTIEVIIPNPSKHLE